MYDLIEQNISMVLKAVTRSHIDGYDWLMSQLRTTNVSADADFQKRYCRYWGLSTRYVNAAFLPVYFQELESAKNGQPQFSSICASLYKTPSGPNGQKRVQASFSSKIVHMIRPQEPIFDSRVELFYFFARPDTKKPVHAQIGKYDSFIAFMKNETSRIIGNGLLKNSINAFRTQFKPKTFTDEKIIDSLIWAFVKVCRGGAIVRGTISFR